MDYSLLLAYGLAVDLDGFRGSGDLDGLSDRMLRDIGYKRVGGRVVEDVAPFDEPVAEQRSRSWSWSLFGRNLFAHKVSSHPAKLA
jgi:hypothetical protein